ncbi:MAG: Actin cross-linking toxin VgrG1 [Pseudomonas citronellolis]|nr:MAG: Actin cross-linking toxin VgrG1 [Pseudomonas citronellolis]
MRSSFTASRFALEILGFAPRLDVISFDGTESLNAPYRFIVNCVSEDAGLDLEALLHQQAFLQFDDSGAGVHGLIQQVGQGESGPRLTHYQLELAPRLDYLRYHHQQRIFIDRTVPEIITEVLQEHGILREDGFLFRFHQQYPKREYCVQYEDSLHFINRLCEELGLNYHWLWQRDRHVLVFGDDQTAFRKLAPVLYQPHSGQVTDQPVIHQFGVRLATRSNAVVKRDYCFENPHVQLEAQRKLDGLPLLEDYVYPAAFRDGETGKQRALRTLERHGSDRILASAESDQPLLRSGHLLPLTGHPRQPWNDLWLITGITHQGRQPQALQEDGLDQPAADDFRQGYRNQFQATPWDAIWRPALLHPKPRIHDTQVARVTGANDDQTGIHTDEYGRIKVVFPWDRRDDENPEQSSCWVRVASNWAGSQYGNVVIPRIGMEALIVYENGDIDVPLCIGAIPNQQTQVPHPLPANKTRSVFRSHSTPNSGGYNELYLEDRAGSELVSVRAQRDMQTHVLHDSRIDIDNERRQNIQGNSYSELHAEEQRLVHGERKVQLGANDHLSVAGSSHQTFGQALTVQADQQIHLKAGAHVVIDAGVSLTLKGGGQHILVGPGGIFSSVPIVLGGAPVPGIPAAPLPPGNLPVLEADRINPLLLQQLRSPQAVIELCQKPKGGTPLQCPLSDCPCRNALKQEN